MSTNKFFASTGAIVLVAAFAYWIIIGVDVWRLERWVDVLEDRIHKNCQIIEMHTRGKREYPESAMFSCGDKIEHWSRR